MRHSEFGPHEEFINRFVRLKDEMRSEKHALCFYYLL